MTKKFKLTKNKKKVCWVVLYQIEALKDFGDVEKGDLGGWIEKEDNLSQDGDAWVYGDAWVSGNASVSGNAQVYGNAYVSGNAQVSGNAHVSGNAQVYGDAWVYKKIKLIGGYFYHTKQKSEKIEMVDTYNDDWETLAREPKIEPIEEKLQGKKVKIKVADNQIIEGEIVD